MIKILQKYFGWGVIVLLCLIPTVRLLALNPIVSQLTTTYGFFSILGRFSSLVGLVLVSLNFVLSTRQTFLDYVFGGLNRAYVVHHKIGAIAFSLLLLHPVLLALRYVPDRLYDAAVFLLPTLNFPIDWPLNFGILSLWGMILLLYITFFVKLPYEFWLLTHKFLGLVFFVGVFHAFLIPSDISADPILRNYMMAIVAAGVIGFTYVTLMGRVVIRKSRYVIDQVLPIGDAVTQITMRAVNHPIIHQAGQFIFVRFFQEGIEAEKHPFSISSPPAVSLKEKKLSITAKKLGDFTNLLPSLKEGALVEIEGPFGSFTYTKADSTKQIWIAGGIGITPFLAMAFDIDFSKYSIDLFYAVKERNEFVSYETLTTLAKKQPRGFRFHEHVQSEQKGFLSMEYVQNKVGEIKNIDIFICGPPGMMKSLKDQCGKLGIAADKVHTEEFSIL